MIKVVVLVGSERKDGNTDLLARAFADGAKENCEVEIISVVDNKINPCIGCNSCFSREGNRCFQADGMNEIYEKLAEADVLCVASPVYFYGISAQLKAVIDRLHTPMRNAFKIKKTALLLVGASSKPKIFDAIKLQYELILDYFKLEDIGIITAGGLHEKGDVKNTAALTDAYNLGKSIK